MKGRAFETVVGFVVLICTIYFFFYSYNRAAWKEMSGYSIVATFDNAEGISQGSLVKVSGVKVGIVNNISIDKKTYLAKVIMTIDGNIQLPKDTEAAITTEGLLGGKYISLSPGFEEEKLAENDEIIQTRGAQNLESLINKFLLKPADTSDTSATKISSTDNAVSEDNKVSSIDENKVISDISVIKTSSTDNAVSDDNKVSGIDENKVISDASAIKTSSADNAVSEDNKISGIDENKVISDASVIKASSADNAVSEDNKTSNIGENKVTSDTSVVKASSADNAVSEDNKDDNEDVF